MNKQQMGDDVSIEDFILMYFLTESEAIIEGESHTVYGIEIDKKSLFRVEKSVIQNITTDKERIKEIIDVIKYNQVTPIHLYDVMETFL